MKIVFVHFGRENLGIEYLSAVLKKRGYQVELVYDCGLFSREDNVFYSPFLERIFKKKDIVRKVIAEKPDIVAFSVYTTTYKWACETSIEIKKCIPVPIVFGGIHPTLVPEKVISLPFVDYVIVGEGEYSFLSLVCAVSENSDLEEVGNLYYKKNGKIIQNPLASPIRDLDNLPFPDKDLFADYIRYKDDYMIMASRGCPYSCSYCCESYLNKIYKNKYFRRRSANSVIEELEYMKKRYSFKEVMFFDSILFNDKKWLKELLDIYRRKINIPFRCTGHVNYFDYETAKLLKYAGCYCIDFGIQSFNNNIRRNILNRNEENEQIKKVFKLCDSFKLRYDVDLMFGLPQATAQDYLLAFDFMKESKYFNRIKCYYLVYYPKLGILEKAKEFGVVDEKDIEDIENGKVGDWFHKDSIKDREQKRWKENFSRIYKIYPILPNFLKNIIVQKELYKWFHLIPDFVVILLQLYGGIKKRDYRFRIYINNYLYNFKKKLSKQIPSIK